MLIDNFGRKINYLRISVIDRCNLRCIYCMPEQGITHKHPKELLSFEEITEIVKAAVLLGIDKIRLTGGEPLIRRNIIYLVKSLSQVEGLKDLSMTTNGILLSQYASSLKEAGLKRVNVSLNSLDQENYKFITRGGQIEVVKEGIKQAVRAGLVPIKINVVLLSGINESEISDFLRLTLENAINVRFLEFMPINSFYEGKELIFADKVKQIAEKFALKTEETTLVGHGPARTYKFKNALGTFGLISPISDKFCSNCNRLRLTSDGYIKPCLHSDIKINLRDSLRTECCPDDLAKLIKLAVISKPKEHSLGANSKTLENSMCQIGG